MNQSLKGLDQIVDRKFVSITTGLDSVIEVGPDVIEELSTAPVASDS